jgi:tetratricopeptide (TPR) repeat protein
MKKVFFLLLMVLLVFSLWGPASAGDSQEEDGYSLSLKELIKQAEENIEKVDSKLEAQKTLKENEKREALARSYFEKGKTLYQQGKLKEARSQWQKALDLTSHPDMKEYIKKSDKKAREELRSQNIAHDTQDEPERGFVLQQTIIEERKLDAKPVPKKKKSSTVKKIKTTPKSNATLKSKSKSAIKEEPSNEPKGFVFEGSSLVDKDIKEKKQRRKLEIKTKPASESDKNSGFKWWWQKNKTEKIKTSAKEETEEVSEKGYTFEGSCLLKNDTKETKKKPSVKPQAKSKPAERKPASKNKSNKKQKAEKEEPEPPKRGYDIFVK